MKLLKVLSIITLTLGLGACHYFAAAKIVTQQGNILNEKQIKSLKLGMSKTSVAIALGNSLITPTFQKDRWDYAFTWQVGESPIMVKRLSLFFKDDKLVKIKTMPNE